MTSIFETCCFLAELVIYKINDTESSFEGQCNEIIVFE